jgi:hypothetical protein
MPSAHIKNHLTTGDIGVSLLSSMDCPLRDKDFQFTRQGNDTIPVYYKKLLLSKADPRYPTAKYVVVVKTYESENLYILGGRLRRRRRYAVGIMTTDNKFYFNNIAFNGYGISCKTYSLLNSIMLRWYNYSMTTNVVLVNMSDKLRDPMELFVSMIHNISCCGTEMKNFVDMAAYINKELRIFGKTSTMKTFKKNWTKKVVRRLYEDGMFSFIEGHDNIKEALESYLGEKKIRAMHGEPEVLIGIIYLYLSDLSERKRGRRRMIKELAQVKTMTEKELMEKVILDGTLSRKDETGEEIETERHAEEHTQVNGGRAP